MSEIDIIDQFSCVIILELRFPCHIDIKLKVNNEINPRKGETGSLFLLPLELLDLSLELFDPLVDLYGELGEVVLLDHEVSLPPLYC